MKIKKVGSRTLKYPLLEKIPIGKFFICDRNDKEILRNKLKTQKDLNGIKYKFTKIDKPPYDYKVWRI